MSSVSTTPPRKEERLCYSSPSHHAQKCIQRQMALAVASSEFWRSLSLILQKNLAEEETQEADAQSEYDKTTQANKITKAMKEQDVKYKTEEHTGLDKAIADLSSDRQTAGTELSAVLEYLGKLNERCIAKPETYEERKRRREAEIAGLKQALSILNGES